MGEEKKNENKTKRKACDRWVLTSLKVFLLDIRKSKWICIQHTQREKGSGKIVKTNALMLASVSISALILHQISKRWRVQATESAADLYV